MHPGDADTVRGGCRRCHPLGREGFREHLDALLSYSPGGASAPSAPAAVAAPRRPPAPFVDDVWSRAGSLSGTPGELYLAGTRGCVGLDAWPEAVRYLACPDVFTLGVRPRPPLGAVGLIVYGFRARGEAGYSGVQVEAVNADGLRIPFRRQRASRVSLLGSSFRGGRRFDVRDASPARLLLVEGPVSALAAPLRFPALGDDWSVAGLAGWAGFSLDSVGPATRVVLCPDGDADGRRAVDRLADQLRDAGRRVWIVPAPDGRDLADLWVRAGASIWRPLPDE